MLAHELTHIRNRDTQLMVIAIIFAGIFAFFGDLVDPRLGFPLRLGAALQERGSLEHLLRLEQRPQTTNRSSGKGSGGAILAIVLAVAIILITWGVSTLIRLALSRSREYLADAGSAELTKNPDA